MKRSLLIRFLTRCPLPLQVGFLYLRYLADPKTLWQWCGPYVQDPEVSTGPLNILHPDVWAVWP